MSELRLKSVTLELHGQEQEFDFSDDPVNTGIEASGDELADQIAVGNALLAEVTSHAVELAEPRIASATVDIEFTYTYSGSITVELDDLDEYSDEEEVRYGVERWDFAAIADEVEQEVRDNLDFEHAELDEVSISCYDEEGEEL